MEAAKELEELERLEAQIPVPPSIWEARRTLNRHVKELEAAALSENGIVRGLERDLLISAREYLQAELPDLATGDTPKDIQRHVDELKDGGRKDALATLVSRLVVYQSGFEHGGEQATIENPVQEAELLATSLTELRPHIQLWRTVTGMFLRN